MSKGPMKGTHGSYVKGTGVMNPSSGSNQRPYYNGAAGGHNTSGAKHAPSQCRYWRQGTCKLGDACRFLHDGARPSTPSGVSGLSSSGMGANSSLNSSGSLKSSGALGRSSGTQGNDSGLGSSSSIMSASSGSAGGVGMSSSQGLSSNLSSSSSSMISSSGVGSEFGGEGLTSTAMHERTGRRPFLKVVVLYASDSRVLRYAKEIQTQFLDSGVDVYLQIDLDNASTSSSSGSSSLASGLASGNVGMGGGSSSGPMLGGTKDNEIKTENLAEIITSSTNADFLIVIGDRNMKNQSCQVKKRGKLVEMEVFDMIHAIWNEWSPAQVEFTDLDPSLPSSAVLEALSASQLYTVLQRFPPQVNFEEAIKRAREAVDEIKTFGKSNAKNKKPTPLPSLMTSSLLSGSTVIFDEKQSVKFQSAQKNLVRIHKQLLALRTHLMELPEARSEETFVINQDSFGRPVGPDYRPQQALSAQISAPLRARLLEHLQHVQNTVEGLGAGLATMGAPLWTGYMTQASANGTLDAGADASERASLGELTSTSNASTSAHLHGSGPHAVGGRGNDATASREAQETSEFSRPSAYLSSSLPQPAANEWSCTYCTSFNELHLKECKVCNNTRVVNPHADDGSWETAGEKKARKKREQALAAAEQAQLNAANAAAAAATRSATSTPTPTTSTTNATVISAQNTTPSITTSATTTTGNTNTAGAKSTAAAVSSSTASNLTASASNIANSAYSAKEITPQPQQPPQQTTTTTPNSTSNSKESAPSSASAAGNTTSTVSTGTPQTKKKLLDPIPGLAAAKQAAAKSSTAKASAASNAPTASGNIVPNTASVSSTPPTAVISTYSSIVSGSAPTAVDPNLSFPALGTPASVSSLPAIGASGASEGGKQNALNEIFGSAPPSSSTSASAVSSLYGSVVSGSNVIGSATNSAPGTSGASSTSAASLPFGIASTLPGFSLGNTGTSTNASATTGAQNSISSMPSFYYNLNGATPASALSALSEDGSNASNSAYSSSVYGYDVDISSSLMHVSDYDRSSGAMGMSYAQWKHPSGSVLSVSATPPVNTTAATATGTNAVKSAWSQPHSKSNSVSVGGSTGSNVSGHNPSANSNNSANGGNGGRLEMPAGLRTPTKSGPMNLVAPHTPTFTTPFKQNGGANGGAGGANSAASSSSTVSRYGLSAHQQQHHMPLSMHLEEFQQAEPKFGIKNPCWFCGEEATVECNLCPKIGLETFFCSPQHQTIVWKHHVRTCHPPHSYENNSYNTGVHQMPPPQQTPSYASYDPSPFNNATHRREPPAQPPLPRYSSPSARHNYS